MGGRRRRLDTEDDPGLPATSGRQRPDEPVDPTGSTRRRGIDVAGFPSDIEAPSARRRPTDGGAPAGPIRRRPDPLDNQAPGARRRPPEPIGPAAPTALPAEAVRRRAGDDRDTPAPRRADPADYPGDPRAGRARTRPSDPDAPATTALPTKGGSSRRRLDPPDDQATTAIPTPRRSRRDAPSPEATAVVPAASRSSNAPDAPVESPAPTTRVVPTDAEGTGRSRSGERTEREADAHTRAMRIDETLTRLTAAHAGLSLAVTDRRLGDDGKSRPRRGAAATAVRLVAGALALSVLGAAAFGWGTKTWLGSAVRDAAALDPASSAVVDAAAQAGDENVLVVATGAAADAAPRADTVAVAHIPDGGGPVTVLAFPLDLEINRPPCERWDPGTSTYLDDPVQAEARTQLATALDLGGPRCITRVVQQLSGIAVTKYVGVDLAAVPALTDAIGGAEVCVPRPVLDGVLGPVVPDAGPNRLAGVRAADFVRAGDVEGEPSAEYGRIERQQQVLAAVLDSAVSGTALLDVGRIAALRPTLADAVLTDGAGIDQVLALAMTLRRLDADGVQYAAVPTGERNGRGNAVLRDTDAAALFAAVRADKPLPAAATDPGAGTAGPTPSEVTVEVVNASARSGLAGEVSETLSSLGFAVGEPGSAEQPTSETVIRFSPDQAAAAELLAATVPSASSTPDPGSTGVLQLVLGRTFDDVVRAPSEPIALAAPTTQAPAEPAVTCT
jgi:LCP family protein required for cell wall assembly